MELVREQRDKRNRIDQRNKIRSSETDVGVYGDLIYDKGGTINQRGSIGCFINGAGKTGQLPIRRTMRDYHARHMQRWNLVGPKCGR